MHISDGVLSGTMIAGGYAVSLAVTGLTLKKLEIKDMPKISVVTAVFFVASLIHIPLGPTSVHLILNGLVGVVLGMASFISIFIGLVLQCLLFQHGGVTSLGWNACMMGLPALCAYFIFNARKSKISDFLFDTRVGNIITCFLTSFIVLFSSIFCLGMSGVFIANNVSSPVAVVRTLGVEDSFRIQALEDGFKAEDVLKALNEGSEEVFSGEKDIERLRTAARNASFYGVLYCSLVVGAVAGFAFLLVGLGMGNPSRPDPSWNVLYRFIYGTSHFSREYVFGFLGGSFAIFGSGVIMAIGVASTNEAFIPIAKMALLAHVFIMIIEGIIVGFTASFLAKVKPEIISEKRKA